MTTRVPIRYGGTGANTAAGARAALGVLANTGGTISGDLTITGNLIVSGNTTTLNTETLVIEDADIVLLSNVTGSPVLNAGITINRGNSTNTFLRWDEGADKWGWSDDGTNTYTFDTALSAYSQANAAYTAANNAKVTVFANNSSNVTTQNINFVNTSTVTVTVSADGSNANVAFTAAPQTVVVDTYAASGNTTAAATANIANGLFAIATDAYAQGNSAYTAANNAANTVRVSQNSTSTLSAKQLNFVNTANVTIVVADSGNGNANISFEVASGTGTLSNIGISSNGVFTTNANAFNFVNTSTVSVSVSSGVNGNANIAFNATVAGVNTVIRSETFTSANAAANLTYNILYYPVAVEYVFVNKNGIGLFPTTDYTLSGNTVTIKEAGESGDNIEIRYFVDVSTVPVSNTTIIVEANTVTAQTNTFTLSQNVATINRLSVTKNGLQLTPNTHYTLANGKTVTLTTLAEVDDQIVFRYFFDLGNIQDVGFTAYQQANAAYDQANLAYTAANNRVLKTGDTLTGTLNVQNVIPTTSNTYNLGSSSARFKDLWLSNSTIYLGDSSISANAGKIIVPAIETSSGINLESQVAAAYTQANSAYGQANAGYTQANSAYTAANTAQTTAQNAYGQANSAYLQANNAYTAANNSNLKLGGVISGTLNVTNDIIVGGNVYLQGNTTFINVATYQINDALMYIAANNMLTDSVDIGFVGGKNTSGTFSHTGLARDATDGKYKLFDNLADSGHVGNVIDFANTSLATLVANVEANTLSVVNGVSGNVNFDSGTLFVDSVSNAVGIGTTQPSNFNGWLTVSGGINILRSGADSLWLHGNNNNTYIEDLRNVPVHILINSVERFTFSNNWYLGLNTTSPQASIHIRHPDPRIRLEDQNGGDNIDLFAEYGAGGTQFKVRNSTLSRTDLTIDGSGNVGIGATSPGTKLDIASAQGSGLTMRYDATTAYRALITPYWNSGTDTRIDFAINSVANQTPSVYMSVGYNGGNVGIGTTSPGAKLDVFGGIRSTTSSTTGTAFSEYLNDLGTMVLQIGLFGSAKSGTTFGLNNANLAFMYTTTYTSGHPSALAIGTTSSQPLVFGTGAAERMRIDGSGNVGIGATNPVYKLVVSNAGGVGAEFDPAGTQIAGGFGIQAYNRSTAVYVPIQIYGSKVILDGGNVGIGTTAPYSLLHLTGNLTMGSGSNARPALKITNWGYSASYRALMIGSPNTTYTTANTGAVTVCFNYDPSANPNGAFSGDGREIIFRRGTRFVTPNSADNAFNLTNLVLYDGCVGIGLDAPETQLHIAKSSSGGLGPQLVLDNTAGSALNNAVEISFLTDNGASPIGTRNARIRAVNENAGDGAARLEFYTWNGGTDAERMRISSGGNVGIGTSPQALLHLGSAAVNTSGDIDTSHTKLIIKQTSNSNKGGIYLERTAERKGYYVWINPSAGSGDGLSFTRNNNGTVSDVMHLDRDGKAIFRGGVILNNIIRTWAVGQPANFITTTATNCFTIKINRTGSPSNYFAGIVFDVYMMGGYDWSGNGFTTYFAKMMVTFFSTDTARAHIIQEYGRSYVNNSGTEILYNSITTSTDANYMYITFRYVGVNASAGYKPNICVITYDNNSNGGDTTIINDVYSA